MMIAKQTSSIVQRPTQSRRAMLQCGAALTLATVIPSCDSLELDPDNESDDYSDPQGNEAPRMAKEVDQGNLPSIAERLPSKPMVVDPVETLGRYGGTWRMAATSPSLAPWVMRQTMAYEGLVRWDADNREFSLDGIIPNVAENFEVGQEGMEYTFYLREGMKWSDGEAFTADDIVFAVNDVLLNTDINPVTPAIMLSGGEVGL